MFYLPSFTPTLASQRDFHTICGEMTYTFNDPDPYDFPNDPYDPEDPDEFLSVFSNFASVVPVGATKPSFTAQTDNVYKATVVDPFYQEYPFTVSAQLVLYPTIQGAYPDALDLHISDPCIFASYENVPHYLFKKSLLSNAVTKTEEDKKLQHGVLADPVTYLIYLQEYTVNGNPSTECGTTVYTIESLYDED